MKPLTFTPAGVVASVVVFLIAAGCVRLGFWQLERLDQRRERNRAVAERLVATPLEGTALGRDSTGLLHRRVRLRGSPDTAHALALSGRSHRGVPGVHLVIPVLLAGGRAVLVDRGWVPSADARTLDYRRFADADTLSIDGIVLPLNAEGRPSEDARVLRSLSAPALRRAVPYELLPFVVQVVGSDSSRGYPRALPPPELGDGPHLSYALQWFGFAGVAIIGWLALVLKRKPGEEA